MSAVIFGNPTVRAQAIIAQRPNGGGVAVLLGITTNDEVVFDLDGLGTTFGGPVIIDNILSSGPITITTGSSAPVIIGQDTNLANLQYNLLSLNGETDGSLFAGIEAAADGVSTDLAIQSAGDIQIYPALGANGALAILDGGVVTNSPVFFLEGTGDARIAVVGSQLRLGGLVTDVPVTSVGIGPTAFDGTAEAVISAALALFTVPIQTSGNVRGATFSVGGNAGVDGTIDLTKTATVEKGIITAIA